MAPFLVFGLTSARAIMPAAIVLTPFAASLWSSHRATTSVTRSQNRLNLVLGIVLVFLPLLALARFKGIDEERFPFEAARHLEGQALWHDDRAGGYLIYVDRLPVFIDDRAELYGEEFFREFVDTRRGIPVWRSVFDRYGIEQALVAGGAGLAEVLTAEGWRVDFADDRWTVFSRSCEAIQTRKWGALSGPPKSSFDVVWTRFRRRLLSRSNYCRVLIAGKLHRDQGYHRD